MVSNLPIAYKNYTFGTLEFNRTEEDIVRPLKLGHINNIHKIKWLSNPLLADKPHQENVTDLSTP